MNFSTVQIREKSVIKVHSRYPNQRGVTKITDRYRVYTKVKKMLKRMMKLDHQGQVVTLAMMISGIVMSRNAQLSAMSSEIPSETKEKSIKMRMRHWVKDTIDVEAVYMPFARQILKALSHLPLVMVMDGSQAGRGCMVLMGNAVIFSFDGNFSN